ncbi:phosphoenolpyruvate carboxykinase (ATP) [bacterium]|nr:phosphoenolpyruvate carboxykinase (ATP) [bacterium]
MSIDLTKHGITKVPSNIRNPTVAKLYTLALETPGHDLAHNGALMADSVPRTGRSPKDKRIVEEDSTKNDIWWGSINVPISESSFAFNRGTAISFLNTKKQLYVVDGFAGWDPKHRIKVRIICTLPYHALFMHNMLIRPTEEELKNFGDPDWVIYNAGEMYANMELPEVKTEVSVNLSFKHQEMIILGSLYAGEMKKGVFTVLNYVLPKKGVLSMHCSANEGSDGDVALFFGLSGTGKTTLSADPKRALIGDDEHGWSDDGVFNFEGGCYAKTINLSQENEPQIYNAIRFGSVLENVGYDPRTKVVDYTDVSKTQNTRVSYPVEFIENAKIPCVGGHPKNVVFLTCDAFGVLPPVSRLTPGQAMYHFISGYTAKVAGTEVGVTEPEATFSACFGAAFLVWHPTKYAEMLAEKMKQHGSNVWLINTGWTGGAYGVGQRFKLKYTRAIVDAVLSGALDNVEFETEPFFGFALPKTCPNVPTEVLNPRNAWQDKDAYDQTAKKLAGMFRKNFEKYADQASKEIMDAEPKGQAKA